MERFSIIEVIEQAVQTERLGYQFYTSTAGKFKTDEGLKNLFTTLAEKELKHEKTFSDLKEVVGDREVEGWEEVSHYMRAIAESEFFLGKNKALPSMESIRTVDDAVKFAIGFEKETLLYFLGVRDAVKEKDVVDEIINEEKSHIRWLAAFKAGLTKR
jgi:rubrerythrin